MTNSGEAAEQIVRLSLEGVEVAAKITGSAAKELAVLLLAVLKNGKLKTKGKARMTSMMKSGKPLEIFSVKERDLKKFAEGAKQYGIVYCVLRDRKGSKDGMCDVLVKAEDAPKISRVVERFKFATVDKAKIESEIVRAKADRAADVPTPPDRNDTESLVNDFLTVPEGAKKEADHPFPSAPTSENVRTTEKVSSKPSVREQLNDIKAARKEGAITHKQPQNRKKSKHKKSKGRSK